MEYVSNKNLCYLITDTLRLFDRRLMDHGRRTGYILYHMLLCKGDLELYEIAEYVFLAFLHDIGAYKTEDIGQLLTFETTDYMEHSIYGYLLLNYLLPFEDRAKIVLYHHVDYEILSDIEYKYKNIASYLHLADSIDVHHNALASGFNEKMFQKYAGTKYSQEELNLFRQANRKYETLERIRNEKYLEDLDELFNGILFNENEKKKYAEFLIYCSGLKNDLVTVSTATVTHLTDEIAKKMNLNEEDRQILFYASIVHDIGMQSSALSIIQRPNILQSNEMELVKTHVELCKDIIEDRLSEKIIQVASAHHERGDGSGYPLKLKEEDFTQLQSVLQVADLAGALMNDRPYRLAMDKENIIKILQTEADKNKLDPEIVAVFIKNYDSIYTNILQKLIDISEMQRKMNFQYKIIKANFKKPTL